MSGPYGYGGYGGYASGGYGGGYPPRPGYPPGQPAAGPRPGFPPGQPGPQVSLQKHHMNIFSLQYSYTHVSGLKT